MFGFGKKNGETPPDVGKEEEFDEKKKEDFFGGGSEGDEGVKGPGDESSVPVAVSDSGGDVAPDVPGQAGNVHIERIEARVESVVEWIKQFYERFSYVSESIGELRTMNLANEKKILNATKDAEKVIDIVKEVKPDQLRLDYQKTTMKMATLVEKINANKLFMDEIMEEMNELRRKSEVFVGTEGLMKLNEDTKKELVETQKTASKTKMQADRAQEIFMELRKGFAESQKVAEIVNTLDESYSGVMKTIEDLKLDYAKVVGQEDYLDFKKTYGGKIAAFESGLLEIGEMKKNMQEIGSLMETSLAVGRRNEEDIGNIGMKVGDSSVKRVSDYENQIEEIVEIVEVLSNQVGEIRKKLGMKVKKVAVKKGSAKSVKKVSKPSENGDLDRALSEVKVAEVPQLKPKEFLGKKNILVKRMEGGAQSSSEADEESAVTDMLPAVALGGEEEKVEEETVPEETVPEETEDKRSVVEDIGKSDGFKSGKKKVGRTHRKKRGHKMGKVELRKLRLKNLAKARSTLKKKRASRKK